MYGLLENQDTFPSCSQLATQQAVFDTIIAIVLVQQAERILKKAEKTHKQRVEVGGSLSQGSYGTPLGVYSWWRWSCAPCHKGSWS